MAESELGRHRMKRTDSARSVPGAPPASATCKPSQVRAGKGRGQACHSSPAHRNHGHTPDLGAIRVSICFGDCTFAFGTALNAVRSLTEGQGEGA